MSGELAMSWRGFERRIRIAREIKLEPLVGRNRIGGAPRQQRLEVRNDQGIGENGAGGLELRNIVFEYRVDLFEVIRAGFGIHTDRLAQDSDASALEAVAV